MHRNGKILTGAKISLMEQNLIDIYDLVEHAIDNAFDGQMNLKFYDYLKSSKVKKHEVDSFIESSTAAELSDLTMELDEYLKGGADSEHKQLREGYGHIPKPQARKIKNYLYGILEDAWRYSNDRKPGRRKKQSK
tara:strand:- start:410 stop:814 length:405 start_codon:yes stop_codon:yes gene_type:complete